MTLLSICQTVVEELTEQDPIDYIAGNTEDDAARQLLAFANKVGKRLSREIRWQELLSEHTFTTTADLAYYSLPADFYKMADATAWDMTSNRRMAGNVSSFHWRSLNGLPVVTSLKTFYRLRGGLLYLYPTPSSVVSMTYDYHSKNWCESAAGTGQTAFAADTDVALIPEDLIALGVKYYFMAANGMDATTAMEEYQSEFALFKSANTPADIIDMGGSLCGIGCEYQGNIPDEIDV